MRSGHRVERALAFGSQTNGKRATVLGNRPPFDQTLGDQLIGDAGDVAAGDHQALRELAHAKAAWIAFELGHQVEARQRNRELIAELRADAPLDQ